MGVCALQHRCITGRYNSFCIVKHTGRHNSVSDRVFWNSLLEILSVLGVLLYVYFLSLLMGIFMKTSLNQNISFPTVLKTTPIIYNGLQEFLKSCLSLLMYTTKNQIIFMFNMTHFKAYSRSICNTFRRKNMLHFGLLHLTLWTATLNLILIVICNPSIINPGPAQKNISVLFQNVRGLISPTELGKPNPLLINNKLCEFKSYMFDKKPDIVILNETWTCKNINDNEIFPNQAYKIFRQDRSQNTHPFDPSDPKKFWKNGGGVIIAVKSDLDCESTLIKIKCKAEILSVEIGLGSGKCICLSTLYRVGTLGAENHMAIDSYLRTIAKRKKYSKIIFIGDLNLNKVSWSNQISSCKIQQSFLDTFNDLNFDQLVEKPTHINGGILVCY